MYCLTGTGDLHLPDYCHLLLCSMFDAALHVKQESYQISSSCTTSTAKNLSLCTNMAQTPCSWYCGKHLLTTKGLHIHIAHKTSCQMSGKCVLSSQNQKSGEDAGSRAPPVGAIKMDSEDLHEPLAEATEPSINYAKIVRRGNGLRRTKDLQGPPRGKGRTTSLNYARSKQRMERISGDPLGAKKNGSLPSGCFRMSGIMPPTNSWSSQS